MSGGSPQGGVWIKEAALQLGVADLSFLLWEEAFNLCWNVSEEDDELLPSFWSLTGAGEKKKLPVAISLCVKRAEGCG